MRTFSDEYFDNPNKRILDDSKWAFEETLNSNEGVDITINRKIDTRAYITNTFNEYSDDSEYRILSVLPEIDLHKGDLISYSDSDIDYWLVRTGVDNHKSHKRAKIVGCNQMLRSKEFPYPQPCYANDSSYGQKGLKSVTYFYTIDGQVLLYIQDNIYTRNIPIGYRFIFDGIENSRNPEAYQVTKNEIITTKQLRRISIKKDNVNPNDDLINSIAYNELKIFDDNTIDEPIKEDFEYRIVSDNNKDKLKLNQEDTYYLVDKNGNLVNANIETNYNFGFDRAVEIKVQDHKLTVKNIYGDVNDLFEIAFEYNDEKYFKEIELVYR